MFISPRLVSRYVKNGPIVNIKIMSLIVVTALSGTFSIDAAYAATAEYPTPLQQQRDGVSIDAIQCNAPRDLYIRDAQIPVCVSASAYDLLLERGVDLVLHESFARTIYTITDAGVLEVQRVVEETTRTYDADRESAFADITALAGNPVVHYPFVLDPDTKTVVAHGAIPDRVGTPSQIILGGYADKPYDVIIGELQNSDGTWVDYIFLDPTTNEDGLKRSWLVLHDGYIFGAGFYYSIEDKINRVLDDAIALYEADGGFDGINALQAIPNAHYPLVIDPVAKLIVAHGAFSDLVGITPRDGDITYLELAAALEGGRKDISRYFTFENPLSGMDDQKHILYKLHDGYIFAAGYYYPAAEKATSVVENTIMMYESDRENAFANINALSIFDPHYPFVLDPDTETVVAHGAFPERANTQSIILSQSGFADKAPEEILAELQGGNGVWVEYVYKIPGTDFEEKKRSYLQMHDGYIFGSGYYFSKFTVIPR